MKNRIGRKRISIDRIGRTRFWIGVFVGLVTATSLSFFFNYTREVLRLVTGISTDLLILSETEHLLYGYFYAALGTALGLSWTIWTWMSGGSQQSRKRQLYRRLAQTYALVVFWIVLLCFSRFGLLISIMPFGLRGYENELDLMNEFWLLFILIPAFLFLLNWLIVRLVYKSTKWIWYSFGCCVLMVFVLAPSSNADREIVNNAYFAQYETEYSFIDSELQHAQAHYAIDFEDGTRKTLRQWYTRGAEKQVTDLKTAFASNRKVTLDTIILEKIVQHNLKLASEYLRSATSMKEWPYALPVHVYDQIKKHETNTPETKELFLLLKEQIDLVNTPELDRESFEEFSTFELRKANFLANQIPFGIVRQLAWVSDTLKADSNYSQFHALLPTIDQETQRKRLMNVFLP